MRTAKIKIITIGDAIAAIDAPYVRIWRDSFNHSIWDVNQHTQRGVTFSKLCWFGDGGATVTLGPSALMMLRSSARACSFLHTGLKLSAKRGTASPV